MERLKMKIAANKKRVKIVIFAAFGILLAWIFRPYPTITIAEHSYVRKDIALITGRASDWIKYWISLL